MYAREYDNKVTIRCNAPSMTRLLQFWTEVQEYMDKGYRYDKESTMTMLEVPTAMTFVRVTLVRHTPVTEPVIEAPKSDKKATAKKPAAKK